MNPAARHRIHAERTRRIIKRRSGRPAPLPTPDEIAAARAEIDRENYRIRSTLDRCPDCGRPEDACRCILMRKELPCAYRS